MWSLYIQYLIEYSYRDMIHDIDVGGNHPDYVAEDPLC